MTTLSETAPRVKAHPELGHRPGVSRRNVGQTERIVSGAVGGVLALQTLRRPSLGSMLLGVLSGALLYRSITGYSPTYGWLGINTARRGRARPNDFFEEGTHAEAAYTINKPAEELYRFWRNFENLPRFMRHLEEVRCLDGNRSHWKAKAPAGTSVEWDAEIINEEENHLIAWRSLEGADVDNAGSVRFLPAPGDRGTEVRVVLEYIPPAGRFGSMVAKLFGEEPQQQITEDLRRFKQLVEAGEIPTTEGQPMGRCE